MLAGAPAQQPGHGGIDRTRQINAERNTITDITPVKPAAMDQPDIVLKLFHLIITDPRLALAEPQLRQAGAAPHQHRESPRRNLGIELALIAGPCGFKFGCAITDHAGEDIQPAR